MYGGEKVMASMYACQHVCRALAIYSPLNAQSLASNKSGKMQA